MGDKGLLTDDQVDSNTTTEELAPHFHPTSTC